MNKIFEDIFQAFVSKSCSIGIIPIVVHYIILLVKFEFRYTTIHANICTYIKSYTVLYLYTAYRTLRHNSWSWFEEEHKKRYSL